MQRRQNGRNDRIPADINGIRNLKKLKAQGSHYRIRMGDYRLGLVIEEDTVCFVRFLHRSEIYKFFLRSVSGILKCPFGYQKQRFKLKKGAISQL
jgi:mRNA-degrading endonuclease RelE of RelBE toxin-antitoxin system